MTQHQPAAYILEYVLNPGKPPEAEELTFGEAFARACQLVTPDKLPIELTLHPDGLWTFRLTDK